MHRPKVKTIMTNKSTLIVASIVVLSVVSIISLDRSTQSGLLTGWFYKSPTTVPAGRQAYSLPSTSFLRLPTSSLRLTTSSSAPMNSPFPSASSTSTTLPMPSPSVSSTTTTQPMPSPSMSSTSYTTSLTVTTSFTIMPSSTTMIYPSPTPSPNPCAGQPDHTYCGEATEEFEEQIWCRECIGGICKDVTSPVVCRINSNDESCTTCSGGKCVGHFTCGACEVCGTSSDSPGPQCLTKTCQTCEKCEKGVLDTRYNPPVLGSCVDQCLSWGFKCSVCKNNACTELCPPLPGACDGCDISTNTCKDNSVCGKNDASCNCDTDGFTCTDCTKSGMHCINEGVPPAYKCSEGYIA